MAPPKTVVGPHRVEGPSTESRNEEEESGPPGDDGEHGVAERRRKEWKECQGYPGALWGPGELAKSVVLSMLRGGHTLPPKGCC